MMDKEENTWEPRKYTAAEIAEFLEEDKIDEETAKAIRKMLAEGKL